MNCRILLSPILVIVCLLVASCYGGDLNPVGSSRGGLVADLRNSSTGKVDLKLVKLENSDTDSMARMVFQYTLKGIEPEEIPEGTTIILTILDRDGSKVAVSEPVAVSSDNPVGEISVSVPSRYESVNAVATLQAPVAAGENAATGDDATGNDAKGDQEKTEAGSQANGDQNSSAGASQDPSNDQSEDNTDNKDETEALEPQGILINIPLRNALLPTRLSEVEDYSLELVEESYSSEVSGQRRVHRFAIRAYDQECISIRGLNPEVDDYFKLIEGGVHDVESPVVFDSRDNVVRVYLVLDASSSISTGANAEGAVRAAVENVAAAMPDNYEIDVRQFTGTVEKLEHYKDYDPDLYQSATAFYYAIDTVLNDIEARGLSNDYNVIIAFTDGLDLSSRNHYGTGYTHASVKQYVTQRVRTFRTTDGPVFGDGLELHVLSMGSVAETDRHNLESLANAGDGVYHHAVDKSELELKFEGLADHVLATYHLEYSSQQLPDDSAIELLVDINDIEKTLPLRQAGGLHVPVQTNDCRVQR